MTQQYKYQFICWSFDEMWACREWVNGRWVGLGMDETLEQCYIAVGLEFGDPCVEVIDEEV